MVRPYLMRKHNGEDGNNQYVADVSLSTPSDGEVPLHEAH